MLLPHRSFQPLKSICSLTKACSVLPSPADSTGMHKAVELRDGDKGVYLGDSVFKAVKNINEKISKALIGMDPTLQSQIDQAMMDLDKTEKKGELGANAILAVSIAACKAGAAEKEVPLYKHMADQPNASCSFLYC